MNEYTVTKRKQISLPAKLVKEMQIEIGSKVRIEKESDDVIRITLLPEPVISPDPLKALGFAKKNDLQRSDLRTTDDWMRFLRFGEKD